MRFSSLFDGYRNLRAKRAPVHRRRRKSPSKRRLTVESLETRQLLATIGGVVFEDLNANQVQDVGEGGLAGAEVYLDANGNGSLDTGELSATTAADGAYLFDNLAAGDYTVAQNPPAGWVQSAPSGAATGRPFGQSIGGFATPEDNSVGNNNYVGLEWVNGVLYLTHAGVEGVADNLLYQLDPVTGASLASPVLLPDQIGEIAFDGANFWGANWRQEWLIKFDPTGVELARYQLFDENNQLVDINSVEWDGDSVWVLDSGARRIYDVNPANGVWTSFIETPDENVAGLGFDGEHFWIGGRDTDQVFELDTATGAVLRAFDSLETFSYGLAVHEGRLWLADHVDSSVMMFDVSPNGGLHTVTLASSGAVASGVDFGDYEPASITGAVFSDANGNGTNDGEAGLEGWRVYVDGNQSGAYEFYEFSTVSDAAGNYVLDNFPPGQYDVGVALREPGWTLTTAAASTLALTNGQQATGPSFGVQHTGLGPVGTEFRVNFTADGIQETDNDQPYSPVALDAEGNFAVVWEDISADGSGDIYVTLFNADGSRQREDIRVNTTTLGNQENAGVAMADNGRFVVTWQQTPGTYARVFEADGTPVTGEIEVYSKNNHRASPRGVAMDADGDFVILLRILPPSYVDYFAIQRFDASGQPQGKVSKVADATGNSDVATLSMDAAGNFIVGWGSNLNVHVQRFSPSGQKVGDEIIVSQTSTARFPPSSMNRQGEFVISWFDAAAGFTAQTFHADGTPASGSFVFAPLEDLGNGHRPHAASIDENGNVLFVWQNNKNIKSRSYTFGGSPLSGETTVNTTPAGEQRRAGAATNGLGQAVVVWSGNGVGDDAGIFAQRYDSPPPAPTPGITVSPTSGLQTSEDLGTDSFTVVLDTQPTADVTIDVYSDDTTEGTVSPTQLTFTPANWDTPQVVVVTGVDDPDNDGDVAYSIVTDPASSTDPAYSGLNADDVAVVNLDNETPQAGALYIEDITINHRTRGRKDDLRVRVVIRQDDGDPGAADPFVAGATVTVQLTSPNGFSQTYTGTTNSNGEFVSPWARNLASGLYTANVLEVTFGSEMWSANPLDNEDDDDGDGKPDEQFTIV